MDLSKSPCDRIVRHVLLPGPAIKAIRSHLSGAGAWRSKRSSLRWPPATWSVASLANSAEPVQRWRCALLATLWVECTTRARPTPGRGVAVARASVGRRHLERTPPSARHAGTPARSRRWSCRHRPSRCASGRRGVRDRQRLLRRADAMRHDLVIEEFEQVVGIGHESDLHSAEKSTPGWSASLAT